MSEQRSTDTDFDVKGPAGMGLHFRGSNQLLLIVLLVMVLACALGFGLWQHEVAAATREVDAVKRDVEITKKVAATEASVGKQEKKIDAVIYVLTLTDKERKALNLTKPEALREMQR